MIEHERLPSGEAPTPQELREWFVPSEESSPIKIKIAIKVMDSPTPVFVKIILAPAENPGL